MRISACPGPAVSRDLSCGTRVIDGSHDGASVAFSIEVEKRISNACTQTRWDLEDLLFRYEQEYPRTIRGGFDGRGRPVYVAGPQNRERLFRLWTSYAVSLCEIHQNEGTVPDAREIVATVMNSCRTLRPELNLSQDEKFREYIVQAVNDSISPTEKGAAQARKRVPNKVSTAGQRILVHIDSNHLCREDFARTAGITPRTLQNIIAKGRGRQGSEVAIAKAMSVRVQELFPPRH